MRVWKIMALACSTALLYAACAAGPEPDPVTSKKTSPTPPPAQAATTVERPTPQAGTNSGIGIVPTPSPGLTKPAEVQSGSNAANALALYSAQGCVQCHGADGKGIMTGAPNFTDKSWQAGRTDSQLTNTIKNGKPPMPGYGSRLSADQVSALEAYVRTFRK